MARTNNDISRRHSRRYDVQDYITTVQQCKRHFPVLGTMGAPIWVGPGGAWSG